MKSFINPDAIERLKSGNADAGFGEYENPLAKPAPWALASLALRHVQRDMPARATMPETPNESIPSEQ